MQWRMALRICFLASMLLQAWTKPYSRGYPQFMAMLTGKLEWIWMDLYRWIYRDLEVCLFSVLNMFVKDWLETSSHKYNHHKQCWEPSFPTPQTMVQICPDVQVPLRQGAPAICPSPWPPPRSSSRNPPPPRILRSNFSLVMGIHPHIMGILIHPHLLILLKLWWISTTTSSDSSDWQNSMAINFSSSCVRFCPRGETDDPRNQSLQGFISAEDFQTDQLP